MKRMRTIITRRHYKRALRVIGELMAKDPARNALEGRALRILAEIMERYEIAQGWMGK